jgi:NarL family two-component system response regulator LiaR
MGPTSERVEAPVTTFTPMNDGQPLRIAILNDYEIVVKGLARMFEPFAERIGVVEVTASKPAISDCDIALYDTFSQTQEVPAEIDQVLLDSHAKRLVIYSWNLHPELIKASLRRGASGYLAKRLNADELVTALERIHAGEIVVTEDPIDPVSDSGDWPGRSQGLTTRESEIIALITQGLSNQNIADRAFLSINSVKSYIRSSYRKMGVTSRSQAVLWGIENGFRPDHVRLMRHDIANLDDDEE